MLNGHGEKDDETITLYWRFRSVSDSFAEQLKRRREAISRVFPAGQGSQSADGQYNIEELQDAAVSGMGELRKTDGKPPLNKCLQDTLRGSSLDTSSADRMLREATDRNKEIVRSAFTDDEITPEMRLAGLQAHSDAYGEKTASEIVTAIYTAMIKAKQIDG